MHESCFVILTGIGPAPPVHFGQILPQFTAWQWTAIWSGAAVAAFVVEVAAEAATVPLSPQSAVPFPL